MIFYPLQLFQQENPLFFHKMSRVEEKEDDYVDDDDDDNNSSHHLFHSTTARYSHLINIWFIIDELLKILVLHGQLH